MLDRPNYNLPLNEIRELYPNLPNAYLDNAACPLFPSTIPYKAAELLCSSQPIVNPHSKSELGNKVTNTVDSVRARVLQLLNVDSSTHEIVFCANATAAAKLVGECIGSRSFYYSVDSHTSLVGLRELAAESHSFQNLADKLPACTKNCVFSWCLQSNFNGKRYPGKEWTDIINARGDGISLLDISSFCSTEMVDLSEVKCDLAVLSFYKIFGFPDLGALVVRKSDKVMRLFAERKYYGGGTVAVITPSVKFSVRKSATYSEMLEDGTLPVHTIFCLQAAMEEHLRLFGSFNNISEHTKRLAQHCRDTLKQKFGESVILMGSVNESAGVEMSSMGPIVSFVVPDIGHNEFLVAANAHDVHVRTGTLCNIGAFMSQSPSITDWTDQDVIRNYEQLGKNCNDEISFIDGKHTGVIRASFGPYSSASEVAELVSVIDIILRDSRVQQSQRHSNNNNEGMQTVTIEQLNVFPIKSCSGLSLHSSEVTTVGLQYDREFCLVNLISNSVLSLKKCRKMALIKPTIIDEGKILHVEYQADGETFIIDIPRDTGCWKNTSLNEMLLINVDHDVKSFFSRALGLECTIAYNRGDSSVASTEDLQQRQHSSLANSSPLLIVNSSSAEQLGIPDINIFRANIVVNSQLPFDEDNWNQLQLGKTRISLMGKCKRCNMICVTGQGESDSAPYMQLCKYRKIDGKLYFGCHATLDATLDDSYILKIGDRLDVHRI